MKKQIFLCLIIFLLCTTSGVAQPGSKPSGSTPTAKPVTDIRQVNFLNFTYHSTQCSQEYGRKGIARTVRVRDGEFKNKSVYFAVVDNKATYGDVTGDGTEDAIVFISCGAMGANFELHEAYIYTLQNGLPKLIAGINDKELERDYRKNYPETESYWGVANGVKITNGNLEIEVLADGPHASPKYIVPMEYHLTGTTLGLTGKPARKNFSQ